MDLQVIEPDVQANEKKRYCQSCHNMSDWHNQSGTAICHTCGQPLNGDEALPDATAIKTEQPAKPEPLGLDEMRQNTERAKAEFEKIETKLNKIRKEKFQALESGDNNDLVVKLSKEDSELSQKLNEAYSFWQVAKKNYESALKDSENQILAEAYFAEYTTDRVEQRAAKAQVFLNRLSELNNLISLVASELTDEFLSVQFGGLNEMQRLVSKLKEMRIGRINGVDISQMRNDSVGSIKPLCQEIGREITLTERHIALLEDCVQKVRKSINFDMLNRGV